MSVAIIDIKSRVRERTYEFALDLLVG
ncbi:uncharacterized protein FFB14_01317 [Fusarium fujikuroi]|nr:uncharacterized protein FFB14_01317 [Fusarium fujikuroi]